MSLYDADLAPFKGKTDGHYGRLIQEVRLYEPRLAQMADDDEAPTRKGSSTDTMSWSVSADAFCLTASRLSFWAKKGQVSGATGLC